MWHRVGVELNADESTDGIKFVDMSMFVLFIFFSSEVGGWDRLFLEFVHIWEFWDINKLSYFIKGNSSPDKASNCYVRSALWKLFKILSKNKIMSSK